MEDNYLKEDTIRGGYYLREDEEDSRETSMLISGYKLI